MKADYDFLGSLPELALRMTDFVMIQFSNDCWAQNDHCTAGLCEGEPVNFLKSTVRQQDVGIDKQVGHSTESRFPDSKRFFNSANARSGPAFPRSPFLNPNGIPSQSPRLRETSYLG